MMLGALVLLFAGFLASTGEGPYEEGRRYMTMHRKVIPHL